MATTDIAVEYVVPRDWEVLVGGKSILTVQEPDGYRSGLKYLHLDITQPDIAYYWLINSVSIIPPHRSMFYGGIKVTQQDLRLIIKELQDRLEAYIDKCVEIQEWLCPLGCDIPIPIGADPTDIKVDKISLHIFNVNIKDTHYDFKKYFDYHSSYVL